MALCAYMGEDNSLKYSLWNFMFWDFQEKQTKCRVSCACYVELPIFLTKWQKFIQHIQYTWLFDKYFLWQVKQTISMFLKVPIPYF